MKQTTLSLILISVFFNMLAGPIDMNNGFFDLRQSPTTRVEIRRVTASDEIPLKLVPGGGAFVILERQS